MQPPRRNFKLVAAAPWISESEAGSFAVLQVELCTPAVPLPPPWRHHHLRCTRCMVELSLTIAASSLEDTHIQQPWLDVPALAAMWLRFFVARRSSGEARRRRQLQLLNIGARSQQLSTFALTKATTTNESVVQVQDSSTSYTTKVPYLPSGRTYFFFFTREKKKFYKVFWLDQ